MTDETKPTDNHIDVTQHGAVGDGSADDTTAINNAIAAVPEVTSEGNPLPFINTVEDAPDPADAGKPLPPTRQRRTPKVTIAEPPPPDIFDGLPAQTVLEMKAGAAALAGRR